MSDEARVNVRRMVLLREPPQRVWTALRDELPAVVRLMEGIDEVRRLERTTAEDGALHTVHEWRAAAAVSAALAQHIDAGALSWIERARWDGRLLESRWTVESRILGRGLVGSGATRVEGAMGGRGTRLRFEVSTSLAPGALGPLGRGRWKDGFEDAAATLLAKTLQDLGGAVERFLGEATSS
jgi:hypothetical protein